MKLFREGYCRNARKVNRGCNLAELKPALSVVIPFYNEKESIGLLCKKLVEVLEGVQRCWEIILVDDGSDDGSDRIASKLSEEEPRIKVIRFRRNRGKASALNEGFRYAEGAILFTMDADLQDDPQEIPRFLEKLEEGYDLVSGWKKQRHDPLEKRLPSKLFNAVTSIVTGIRLHDFNCGFKAYRREIVDEIKLYGELHRYVPALAHWRGFRVAEIAVKHHPRQFGKSKYGIERYIRGFFDVFTVVLITKYIRNPAYFFGMMGMFIFFFGMAILSFLTVIQIVFGSILGFKVLSYIGALAILAGCQGLSVGLLSEVVVNLSQKTHRSVASVKEVLRRKRVGENELSVVIPVFNETRNLASLHSEIEKVLQQSRTKNEIVFVDDGSTDGSFEELKQIYEKVENTAVIRFRRNHGKALALQSGFDFADGDILVTIDADHQDDPAEIPRFLEKLDEGYDFVIGHRVRVPLWRALGSRSFNIIVSVLSGIRIHDLNCGLKAFRRDSIANIKLYGELQRFFPIFVSKAGYGVTEIEVQHRERRYGQSKYGWTRIPKAFIDLLTVILLTGFRSRPLHLFGSIGGGIFTGGLAICIYLLFVRISSGGIGGHYTLLLMGVMLVILGVQWFSVGLLSELLNEYYEEIAANAAPEKMSKTV